ncbi:hypothetical protein [Mammaliicoccus sciuri]|uniref:hypothetical protein n=1 Tax=Mammaliicoccus sciuri TaxID=1296 RepID=UPI0034DD8217
MMNVRLNIDSDKQSTLSTAIERRKQAGVGETIADAFARIYGMKNTEPDLRKIQAVEQALNNGEIGREQAAVDKGKKLSKAEVLRLYQAVKEAENKRILADMVENMPSNYNLVLTEQELDEMVETLMQEDIIVFDVESTGTDVWSDLIVGHVLSATRAD